MAYYQRRYAPLLLLVSLGVASAAGCVREKPTTPAPTPLPKVSVPDRDLAGKQRPRRPTMGALEANTEAPKHTPSKPAAPKKKNEASS